MKILNSSKEGNTIFLEVEQSPEAVKANVDAAYKKVAKDAKIPGFRKGKIPRTMFEKYFGKESIIREGLMDAVNLAYAEAVQLLDLRVIDYPRNLKIGEYQDEAPVKFSCEIDILPEVKLGTYKGLTVTVTEDTVNDDKVNAQIDRLRDSYATYEATDRAAQANDVIRANIEAKVDGDTYAPWTREGAGIRLGLASFGTEFDTQVSGMSKGESKEFSALLPDDFNNTDTAGKNVDFKVTIDEVREKHLPEVNDEFAGKVSQYTTAEELIAQTRAQLESEAKAHYTNDIRNQIIQQIVANSELEIHPVLVQREVDQMVHEFESNIRRIGYNLDQYVKATGTSLEQLRDSYTENAGQRVKADLTLSAISDQEKIEVTDADVIAEIQSWNTPELNSEAAIASYLKQINIENLKYSVRRRKTLDFLVANTTIKN
jgi:trigger factor